MEILTGSGSSVLDTLKLELGLGSKKIWAHSTSTSEFVAAREQCERSCDCWKQEQIRVPSLSFIQTNKQNTHRRFFDRNLPNLIISQNEANETQTIRIR